MADVFERAGRAMGAADLSRKGAFQKKISVTSGIKDAVNLANKLKADTNAKTSNGEVSISLEKIPPEWQSAYLPWALEKKNRIAELKGTSTDDPDYNANMMEIAEIEKSFLNFSNQMDAYAKLRESTNLRNQNLTADGEYQLGRANSMTSTQSINFDLVLNDNFEQRSIGQDGSVLVSTSSDGDLTNISSYYDVGSSYDKKLFNKLEKEYETKAATIAANTNKRKGWNGTGENSKKAIMRDLRDDLQQNPQAAKNLLLQDETLTLGYIEMLAGQENLSYQEYLREEAKKELGEDSLVMSDDMLEQQGMSIVEEYMRNIDNNQISNFIINQYDMRLDNIFESEVKLYKDNLEEEEEETLDNLGI
tara:strand:+ start:4498 stop:5586 length:1089 start_codon:yes stop_codon:yes gene_type:complete